MPCVRTLLQTSVVFKWRRIGERSHYPLSFEPCITGPQDVSVIREDPLAYFALCFFIVIRPVTALFDLKCCFLSHSFVEMAANNFPTEVDTEKVLYFCDVFIILFIFIYKESFFLCGYHTFVSNSTF